MKYQILYNHKDFLQQVFDFFTSKITNEEYFKEIESFCSTHKHLKQIDNHNALLSFGHFIKDDFTYFINESKKKPFAINMLTLALKALEEANAIDKLEPNTINNPKTLYFTNEPMAKYYKNSGVLFNSIFGFEYIAEKYVSSVFKIETVRDSGVSVGTGFLLYLAKTQIIVTNYHVIENADEIVVKTNIDNVIEYENITLVKELDLAFIKLKVQIDSVTPFNLNTQVKILDEILTIGYPPVPTTKFSYPLFHLGEINSFVENYSGQQLFLFSAKTNPGNSGSPIIDKRGNVVGIVTQQLEEKDWYKDSKLPYYAGIPSKIINRNLGKVFENKN